MLQQPGRPGIRRNARDRPGCTGISIHSVDLLGVRLEVQQGALGTENGMKLALARFEFADRVVQIASTRGAEPAQAPIIHTAQLLTH